MEIKILNNNSNIGIIIKTKEFQHLLSLDYNEAKSFLIQTKIALHDFNEREWIRNDYTHRFVFIPENNNYYTLAITINDTYSLGINNIDKCILKKIINQLKKIFKEK